MGAGCLDGSNDAGLLAHLVQVVRRLGADPLSGAVDDEALTASVAVLHRAETMVAAEKLRRIGEVDARKAYRGKAVSTADWAASRLGMTRWEAKTAAATAAALTALPETAAKLADGHIGIGHAQVAARALDDLQRAAEGLSRVLCERLGCSYRGRRPGKVIASALSARVHPWVWVPTCPPRWWPMLRMARYSSLRAASSVGKCPRVLVILRSW